MKRGAARLMGRGKPSENEQWQRSWADAEARSNFHWHLDDVPPQLLTYIASAENSGVAVDLGCGDGKSTCLLAEHFDLAVGLDVASEAVRIGNLESSSAAQFLVGDVQSLPLRTDSIDFVFDRGCLHLFRGDNARLYLDEVRRVLRPGARALFIEKSTALDRALESLPRGIDAQSREDFTFESANGPMGMSSVVLSVS